MSELADAILTTTHSLITLDMENVTWLDANMCSPLGAILYKSGRQLNTIRFNNLKPPIKKILSKNNFLSNFGVPSLSDTYKTTIPYSRFELKDEKFFSIYLSRQFQTKAVPVMSTGLRKKFWESIFEIFSNAVIHSETQLGIFACGQFYPNKNLIDFSISDLGLGMKNNLEKKRGIVLSAEEAIQWSMEAGNTTKTGPIPGGLGLKILQEFVKLNHGRIQIMSDRGYWEQDKNGIIQQKQFQNPFPGTMVNVEINTADKSSY